MSELKRATSDYQFSRDTRKPADADIEHSQPRQTLELPRAAALLSKGLAQGVDPYNSVGVRIRQWKTG
jgi:hypothetical protein